MWLGLGGGPERMVIWFLHFLAVELMSSLVRSYIICLKLCHVGVAKIGDVPSSTQATIHIYRPYRSVKTTEVHCKRY
jgi:hypothetical protein